MVKVFRRRISLGFSLIEILVTTGVMALVLTTALISYNRVVRRQRFEQGVQNIFEEIRLTRDKALSGEKPAGCNSTLTAYVFRVGVTPQMYQIGAYCNTNPSQVIYVKSGAVPSILANQPPGILREIIFPVFGGQVTLRNHSDVGGADPSYEEGWLTFRSLRDTSQTATIAIGRGGEIYLTDSAPCVLHQQDGITARCTKDPDNCCAPYVCQGQGNNFRCRELE